MGIIPNNESLSPSISGLMTSLKTTYKSAQDTILYGGRDLLIDLPPHKTECSSGCVFNPTYKQYIGPNGSLCRHCVGKGFTMEHRQTIYKCNRRWTSEPLDGNDMKQGTQAGRLYGNFVVTKTHISSFDHISQSIGATIDGLKVKLYREPYKRGWADETYYVIAWWERTNKSDG